MQEYYLKKYGVEAKIERENIKELCHEEKDEEGRSTQVCTDGVLAVTNDGTYIYSLDKENFSDSMINSSVVNSYKEKIKSYFDGIDYIGNDPHLAYKDYYETYNSFIPYINMLPNNQSFDELYSSNKLTVRDMILYSGELNYDFIKPFLDGLSEDSLIVFINSLRGIPLEIYIYRNKEINYFSLDTKTQINETISYYGLDNTRNGTPDLSISKVLDKSITTNGDYTALNAHKISFSKPRTSRYEDPKSSYYFVELSYDIPTNGDMLQFNPNGSDDYRETDRKSYADFMKLSLGGSTYLFGDEPIGFANMKYKSKKHCFIEFCNRR
jgi:hypothetical protein